jgi:hypothetical protein
MSVPRAFPHHRRITLDEFLAFTGWTITPGTSRTGMQTALDFYQDKIPRSVLMQQVLRPSPWSLPRGNVIKLSELMQAIDFTRPVVRTIVGTNERLKCFRPRGESKSRLPKGNWFTYLSSEQRRLAIPGEQDLVRVYVVKRPVECLRSSASDAFTWIRKTHEQIQHESLADRYFRGGGCQYFIWEPARYLELA